MTGREPDDVLTARDRVFLGAQHASRFTALIASPIERERYPENVAFLLSLTRGTYEPDAPARELHGTLDPDAWNAAVQWIAAWCEANIANPWMILTSSILAEIHETAATDPRATDETRSRIVLATALG